MAVFVLDKRGKPLMLRIPALPPRPEGRGFTRKLMNSYIASLSDEKLIKMTITAQEDYSNIKMSDIGGEWHVSCVAGLIVLAREMEKRGLKA